MFRPVAAISAALTVTACASSPTPLLTGPDPAAPTFAKGVWAVTGAGCDLTTAATAWPKCALKLIVTEDKIVRGKLEGVAGPGAPSTEDELRYRLGGGTPVIAQLEEPPDADDGGKIEFNYHALRPVGRNAKGDVVRADIWPVTCPEGEAEGFTKSMVGCTVLTLKALRERATVQAPLLGWSLTWVSAEDRTGR